jgi:thiamine biosynthesis lipoprotein
MPIILVLHLVPAVLLASSAASAAPARPAGRGVAVVFSGPALDRRYTVRVVMPAGDEAGRQKVRDAIARELGLADRLFSGANPASEVSRLNTHLSREPFPVAPETLALLELARRAGELTAGAFDVTAAPLALAWGFGSSGRSPTVPPPDEMAAVRARVGHSLLELDAKHRLVTKARPEVVCDLSGLAFGWVADRVAGAIAALGYRGVLVDMGGEVAARGRRADGRRWHVALDPTGGEGPSPGPVLELEDAAVATSGEYRGLWTDKGGRKRSRVIDPRTGEPAENPLGAASVVHRDGAWADALARALLVLGPEAARALAAREGLPARLVERRSDGTVVAFATPELEPLLVP